jgi:hypothetical protein
MELYTIFQWGQKQRTKTPTSLPPLLICWRLWKELCAVGRLIYPWDMRLTAIIIRKHETQLLKPKEKENEQTRGKAGRATIVSTVQKALIVGAD